MEKKEKLNNILKELSQENAEFIIEFITDVKQNKIRWD